MSLVPNHLPIRVAAALIGRSEPGFRRDVLPSVALYPRGVDRLLLEDYLQRAISEQDYLAAWTRLEPRRRRERAYRHA